MRSQPPASEEEPQKLVVKGLRDLEAAEESAEATGNEALQRHPHLSGALRVGGGVLREQGVEAVGLAAAGATFWLVISAFPTAIAAVSPSAGGFTPEWRRTSATWRPVRRRRWDRS